MEVCHHSDENFLLCGYRKSVVLKGCPSLLLIHMTVNFKFAPFFIQFVKLLKFKTKSRKTND